MHSGLERCACRAVPAAAAAAARNVVTTVDVGTAAATEVSTPAPTTAGTLTADRAISGEGRVISDTTSAPRRLGAATTGGRTPAGGAVNSASGATRAT